MKIRCLLLSIALLGFSLCATFAIDIHVGLVGYWPLDADNGDGTTSDFGYGNPFTIQGGATVVPGVVSNAFSFDGVSKYLLNNHDTNNAFSGLPIYTAGSYSVSMWVKAAPGQNSHYLFTEGSTTNANPLFILQTANTATGVFTNKLDIIIRSTAGTALINHIKSTNVVFDNTWHHIAFVDTNGTCKLYVDGNLDPANFNYTPQAAGAFAFNTTALGALVRSSVSGFFNGSLDNVAVWERALSQAEVQSVMSNSIPLPFSPLPPFITKPFSASTNALGDYVILTGNAIGQRPLSYQWYLGGQALAGQTGPTLVLYSLTTPTNVNISVVASNSVGFTTNGPLPFVVLPDAPANISSGLISYWPFDTVNQGTVTNTPDLYSHDEMQLANMDTNNLVPGEFASALNFDGVTQYGNRVGGASVFTATNYTVSLWVNGSGSQAGAQARIFSEGSTANNNPLFTLATDNSNFLPNLSVFIRNDAGAAQLNVVASAGSVFDGSWHHIVWTDQNGKALLYIDGVLDSTSFAYTRTGTYTMNTTSVGAVVRGVAGNFFAGQIDEVAVWTRRLSYTEIQQIQSVTLPPPVKLIPPAIAALTSVPPDLTNGVFQGDTVTLTVQATGSNPLSYQWKKNGTAISPALNPTATNSALVLTNVQTASIGTYSVVVTNGGLGLVGGSVTGMVTLASVLNFTPATNGLVLAVDFELTGALDTQPGFQAFNLGINGSTYNNAVGVTVTPIGSILAERDRGAVIVNAPPVLTQATHYNKFMFANIIQDGTGLSILINHLAPNTVYGLTVWSYDSSSPGARVSDWTETSSGTSIPITSGYTFDGSVKPTTDYDYTFGALLTSWTNGTLQIQGLRNGGTSFGVFVDAIQLVANPTIQILSATLAADGNLQLTVQAQYPGQSISFLESPDLSKGSFVPATDATITATHGPIVTAEFPFAASQLFYRAVSP